MHYGNETSNYRTRRSTVGCLCFGRVSTNKMGSLRELQHALQEKNSEMKMKDSRIMALEQELRRKDELVRRLESELDKYRSVLQPASGSTATGGRARNQRQGISAEPQNAKAVVESSKPLQRHTKTSRQAMLPFVILLMFFAYSLSMT